MNIFPPFRTALFIPFIFSLLACGGGGGGGTVTGSDSYRVSTEVEGGGSISPGSASLGRGTTSDFTLTPDDGYVLDLVEGCPGEFGGGETYTVGPITGSCTLRAVFVPVFAVTGTVTGLEGSITLKLFLNGSEEILTLSSTDPAQSRTFEFTKPGRVHWVYSIKVVASEAGYQCDVHQHSTQISADGVPPVAVTCEQLESVSLSGRITPVANIEVDSDINDKRVPPTSNAWHSPQTIKHPATVQGFVSLEPTGGSTAEENFSDGVDDEDWFSVKLSAGQTIQLWSMGYGDRTDYDLDLFVYGKGGLELGSWHREVEAVKVPEDGTYEIAVVASYGISKYELRFLPPNFSVLPMTVNAVPDFVPNEMVAKLKHSQFQPAEVARYGVQSVAANHSNGPQLLTLDATAASASGKTANTAFASRHVTRKGYDKAQTIRAIKVMRRQPGIVYAEPNYIHRPMQVTPNDTHFTQQWHYNNIHLPQAWELATGAGPHDEGVIVAVVDTGILSGHPDFVDKLVPGYDFASHYDRDDVPGPDGDPEDEGDSYVPGESSWHGTHVAGTVAAATDNGEGVAGVSWGAKIMPVRVLRVGGGSSYDVIQGVRYAAGLDTDIGVTPDAPADIINLSLGSYFHSEAEAETFAAARKAGAIIVAAAGNARTHESFYPASYPGVISVSATDYNDNRARYSNAGRFIALAAPGGDVEADENADDNEDGVLSTLANDEFGVLELGYGFYNGTSMAAPHVSGVLALMKSVYPELTPDEVDQLIAARTLTTDINTAGWDGYSGFGLLNALKAVEQAFALRAGEELPPIPATVIPSQPRIDVWLDSEASVTLTNIGVGAPHVTRYRADTAWLSVSATETDFNGLGKYSLDVNREGLADGFYLGEVTFEIDGAEDQTVEVEMLVWNPPPVASTMPQLYVQLIESDTNVVVKETIPEANPTEAVFQFTEVPVGNYKIVAGSDIDVDGHICGPGEVCGVYPVADDYFAISKSIMENLDFKVDLFRSDDLHGSSARSQ